VRSKQIPSGKDFQMSCLWLLASDELLFPYRIESDWERVAKRLGDPGRVTGELTALVGARVMEEHYHPALVDQFTVLEGALSIFLSGLTHR
jgi:hypothetical protein